MSTTSLSNEDYQDMVSPYMSEVLGPLRVLDVKLECTRGQEGKYHYVYQLTAEPRAPNSSSIPFSPAKAMQPISFVFFNSQGKKAIHESEFVSTTKIRNVLLEFRNGIKGCLAEGRFEPRLALKTHDASRPLERNDFDKTLGQVIGEQKGPVVIIADMSSE